MNTILKNILDALLNPKPSDQQRRNPADDYQYGPGLILIPVPTQRSRDEQHQMKAYCRK